MTANAHLRRRGLRVLLAVSLASMPISVAPASGGFFLPPDAPPDALRPSVARERVLVIYDAAEAREYVVAEVRFRNALETFEFVVPAPTRPQAPKSVHMPDGEGDMPFSMDIPFVMLRAKLPFDPTRVEEDADVDGAHVSLSSTSVLDASIAGLLHDFGSGDFVGEPGVDAGWSGT
jgi:hypothetical protein